MLDFSSRAVYTEGGMPPRRATLGKKQRFWVQLSQMGQELQYTLSGIFFFFLGCIKLLKATFLSCYCSNNTFWGH